MFNNKRNNSMNNDAILNNNLNIIDNNNNEEEEQEIIYQSPKIKDKKINEKKSSGKKSSGKKSSDKKKSLKLEEEEEKIDERKNKFDKNEENNNDVNKNIFRVSNNTRSKSNPKIVEFVDQINQKYDKLLKDLKKKFSNSINNEQKNFFKYTHDEAQLRLNKINLKYNFDKDNILKNKQKEMEDMQIKYQKK